jgi:S-adenosylmethionine:tRNA ribosyltransferase-isomerase
VTARLDFDLPSPLEASEPPEARGGARDAVRMMVAFGRTGELVHTRFPLLPAFLDPGDLVVVNTSRTIPAALDGVAGDGSRAVVHLSTHLDGALWAVEPRKPGEGAPRRWPSSHDRPPPKLILGENAHVELLEPYMDSDRLWVAEFVVPEPVPAWLAARGRPIRYRHVDRPWPLSAYQNVYATEPGSAEMPSAGRPFTADMITRLVAAGVGFTPVVLHTGVASLEASERPYPERMRVPRVTAARVNAARAMGGRVIAVGTTVVRALESAVDPTTGDVHELDGWTDLVVTPDTGVRTVDGLLTGWHEPEASHLLMLEALAGRQLLERSYEASLKAGYLWHEFGDVHLLLP